MIFKAERTSNNGNYGKQPFEESYKGYCLDTDTKDLKTFEEYNEKFNEDFRANGINHREEDGHIARDFIKQCYLVEINTLEELMEIKNKYGDIIIWDWSYDYPILEIYDNYRE